MVGSLSMADGTLPLNPATIPGGQVEDIETLIGAGGALVLRQRLQVCGAILAEVARVINADPTGAEFGLVTRNIAQRTSTPPTTSKVVANVANVQLLAANPARKMALFQAITTAGAGTLFLKLGIGATANDFSVQLVPGAYYEMPSPVWTGEIDGIWTNGVGAVQITEIT